MTVEQARPLKQFPSSNPFARRRAPKPEPVQVDAMEGAFDAAQSTDSRAGRRIAGRHRADLGTLAHDRRWSAVRQSIQENGALLGAGSGRVCRRAHQEEHCTMNSGLTPAIEGGDKCAGLRQWLRQEEVAELLGVTADRLKSWRLRGCGPRFIAWNRQYVLYCPRSVACFRRRRSPFDQWRRCQPLLGIPMKKD